MWLRTVTLMLMIRSYISPLVLHVHNMLENDHVYLIDIVDKNLCQLMKSKSNKEDLFNVTLCKDRLTDILIRFQSVVSLLLKQNVMLTFYQNYKVFDKTRMITFLESKDKA